MARLDIGWHAHPKLLGLGLAAMGLHAWSISYCDATRSDGFIPTGAWPALPGVNQARARLEKAGLWATAPGGYLLHDYTDYNRTRAQIESQHAEDRARKRTGFRPESNGIPRAPGPGPGPGPLSTIPVPVNPTPTPSLGETPNPQSGETPHPRENGTNPRAQNTNPRARRTNPRVDGSNPRANGTNPRSRPGGLQFDEDGPRFKQRVGADGKREWVEVEA